MKKFERMWRKEVEQKDYNPYVKTYVSLDGRWKINYRTISSSKDRVEKAGYKVEVTLDVIDETKKRNNKKEIKFITVKN